LVSEPFWTQWCEAGWNEEQGWTVTGGWIGSVPFWKQLYKAGWTEERDWTLIVKKQSDPTVYTFIHL
jgi:hypothetical protein